MTTFKLTPGTGIFNTTVIDTLELFAESLAGTYKPYYSEQRTTEVDDCNYGIIYTSNRDSDLLALSNHDHLLLVLKSAITDGLVVERSERHFAVGFVSGISFPIYREDGQIYHHVRIIHDLALRLAQYPILDEDDYSQREHEAMQESLKLAVRTELGHSEFDFDENLTEMIVEYINTNVNNLECDQFGYVIGIDVTDYFFPSIEASIDVNTLADMLLTLSTDATFFEYNDGEDEPYLDVRLNYTDTWNLLYGLSDYDTSHLGLWACSSLSFNQSLEDCQAIAQELISGLE